MAIARMRRACLASAIRAASARNCEILRSWRVISIADMLPRSPNQQQDESSHVCGCLGIPQESDSRALGISCDGLHPTSGGLPKAQMNITGRRGPLVEIPPPKYDVKIRPLNGTSRHQPSDEAVDHSQRLAD